METRDCFSTQTEIQSGEHNGEFQVYIIKMLYEELFLVRGLWTSAKIEVLPLKRWYNVCTFPAGWYTKSLQNE